MKDFEFIIPSTLCHRTFLWGKLLNLSILFLFVSFVLLPTNKIWCEPQKTPSFSWQLNVKWKDVPLAEIPIPDTIIKVMEGYANIFLTFDNSDVSGGVSYKGEGNITKCRIYLSQWNEEINQISGSFVVEDKELKVNSLEGQFKNTPFTAQANIKLTSPYPFTAKVKANDIMIEELSSIFPFLKTYSMIKTPAEAEFNINGVLPDGPLEGTAILQEICLYSLLMNNVEISFTWDGNKVIIKNFSANMDEGKISGEGEIILKTK